ncbi:MAG: ABC transporter substrate-binding protein [Nitrososphaerota archaeon]|jgi:ABC-type nitrate/sulfonate/bicarbonate transport system substrate-binding protein|nr:ABC transporter substrate-binding protein [Nitrososphaerota archaeon]
MSTTVAGVIVIAIIVIAAGATYAYVLTGKPSATSSTSATSAALTPVSIAMGQASVQEPLYNIAVNQSFFAQEGLAVTPQIFSSGSAEDSSVASGAAVLGVTGGTPFESMVTGGVPIVALAQLNYATAYHFLIVKKSLNVTTPQQLEGLTLGLTFSSDSQYIINAMFTAVGLNNTQISKIKLVNLAPNSLISAYKEGQIDGIAFLWSPFIQEAEAQVPSTVLAQNNETYFGGHVQAFPQGQVSSIIFASQAFAAAHPSIVQDYLRAMMKAQAYFNANRTQALTIVSQAEKIPVSTLNQYLGTGTTYTIEVNHAWLNILQNEIGVMYGLGVFKTSVNITDYIYSTPLAQIAPSRVTANGGYTPS